MRCFCGCFWVSVSTLSESVLRYRLVMSCAASLFVITPLLWNCWSVISLRHSHHPSLTLAKSIPMNFIFYEFHLLCSYVNHSAFLLHCTHLCNGHLLDYTCHTFHTHTLHLLDCLLLPSPHPALSGFLSVKTKYLSINLTAPPHRTPIWHLLAAPFLYYCT